MNDVDDQSLYRQIDQLTNHEHRGVIKKYLGLLNAELAAVQNALNYTFQQRQKKQPSVVAAATMDTSAVEDSFEAEFSSEFDNKDNEDPASTFAEISKILIIR